MVIHVQSTRSVSWLTTEHHYCDVTSLLIFSLFYSKTIHCISADSQHQQRKPSQTAFNWLESCVRRQEAFSELCKSKKQNKNECNKRFKTQSKSLRYTLVRRRTSASLRNVSHSTFPHLKSAANVTGRLWVSLFLFKTVNTFILLERVGCRFVFPEKERHLYRNSIQITLIVNVQDNTHYVSTFRNEISGGERNAKIMNKCFWRINMFTA